MRHFHPRLRTPSIVKCLAVLWMLASFLRCHYITETLNLTVKVSTRGGGGLAAKRGALGVVERILKASPSVEREAERYASGRLANFGVEGRRSSSLPRSIKLACPSLLRAVSVRRTQFNSRQPRCLRNV